MKKINAKHCNNVDHRWIVWIWDPNNFHNFPPQLCTSHRRSSVTIIAQHKSFRFHSWTFSRFLSPSVLRLFDYFRFQPKHCYVFQSPELCQRAKEKKTNSKCEWKKKLLKVARVHRDRKWSNYAFAFRNHVDELEIHLMTDDSSIVMLLAVIVDGFVFAWDICARFVNCAMFKRNWKDISFFLVVQKGREWHEFLWNIWQIFE